MSKSNLPETNTRSDPEHSVSASKPGSRSEQGKQSGSTNQRHSQQLRIIQEINQIVSSEEKIEEILQKALRHALESLDYQAAQVYRLSPFGKDLWLYLDIRADQEATTGQKTAIFSIEENNFISQAVRKEEPIYLPTIRQDSQIYPVTVETGRGEAAQVTSTPVAASELAVPLQCGQVRLGALRIQSDAAEDFSENDISFFTSLSSLLAMKIQMSQTVQQLQDQLQEMQILYKLQRKEEEEGRRLAGSKNAASGYEYNQANLTTLDKGVLPSVELALGKDQVGVSTIQDHQNQELIAPLTLYDEVIGVLGVQGDVEEQEWTTDDISLLEEVSSQVALAIENSRLLQQTQERSKELTLLFETSRQLSETIQQKQIYDILTSRVINYLNADACSVWLLGQSQKQFDLVVSKGRDEAEHIIETTELQEKVMSLEQFDSLEQLVKLPELIIVHSDDSENDLLESWREKRSSHTGPAREQPINSLAIFPLVVRNRVVGFLDVEHFVQRRVYTTNEIQLVQAIISRATVAVENAQLFQQTENALTETQKLYQISRSFVESATTEDIFDIVLDTVKKFGIDRVSVSLLDRDEAGKIDGVTIVASWDRESETVLPIGTKLSADTFSLVQAFAKPPFYPMISEDLSRAEGQDERMDDAFRLFMLEGLGAITLFSAPMFLGNEYKGVLSISTRSPHHYEQQEIRIYQTLADQAIIAIERQRLLEATRQERDRASLLYELGQVLSRTTSIDEVEQAILEFRKYLKVTHAEIYVTDGEDFAAMASTIPVRQTPNPKSAPQTLPEGQVETRALSTRRTIVESRGQTENDADQELAGLVSISTPFYSQRSSLQGVLTFFRPEEEAFTPDQISTIESVAVQTSAALENVWLLEQTADALRETELLYTATRDFNSARHVEELLVTVVESFTDLDIDHVSIGEIPPVNRGQQGLEELTILNRWRRDENSIDQPAATLSISDYPFIRNIGPNAPYQVHYDQLEEAEQEQVDQFFGKGNSILCVPLRVGKNWLGVLLIGAGDPDVIFKLNTVNQIFALAGQAAVVMQNLQLVEETQQNLFHSEILSHLSQELLGADTTETIYNLCLEAIAATEPERGAAIFMYDQIEGSVELEMVALWNNPVEDWPHVPVGARFSTEDLGLGPLLKTGQTVVSLDALEDERFAEILRQLLMMMQITSLVAIPIWLNKDVNGFLLIGHHTSRVFPNETVRLYEDIARQVSGALENRRLFEEAQYRASLLQTAAEISQAATGSLDLDTLLPQTVELIRDRFGFYHASIFLVDEYQKYAIIKASTGEIGKKMLSQRHKLDVGGKSIVGAATGTGKPRIALDVGKDAYHFNNPLLPETRSEMALPLIARGRVIGALDVQSTKSGAFSQSDITILQSMANQLANAIQAAQSFQESREALEEVSRLHEYYLREQWGTFLAEKRAAISYHLTDQGLLTGEQLGARSPAEPSEEIDSYDDLVEQAITAKRPLISRRDGAGEPLDREQTAGSDLPATEKPAGDRAKVVAPLTLHDGVVIGTLDFDVENATSDWEEDELRIIEAVTSQAAQAVEAARLFEQTRVAREEAEALYQVGRALVASENTQEMYHTVLRAMLSTLGLKQGGILFFDEDRKYGTLHALFENSQPAAPGLRFPIEGNLSYETLIQSKRPVAIEDIGSDPLVATVKDINLARGIASLLLVPIVVNDEVIGAMGADALGQKHLFTEREINLASAMADQLSLMLQNRRLLEETRRRAVLLQASADISRVATSILDQDTMLDEAVELIRQRFGFNHVQIFLVDQAGQYAALNKSTGEAGQELLARRHKLAIGNRSIIGQVTHRRTSLVARNTDPSGSKAAQFRNEFLPDTQAELAIPLQVGDTLIGALDLHSALPDAFTKEDIASLETLASQVAIAIQNARAFREQQETAERLKEIDKLKTQFLANMSHELRTPLNSIIGFSRVILKGIDGPLTDLQKTDLTSIHNSGQHLLGLINNILDLSKIEAGKMELNFEEVEIEPILKGVMSTAIALVKDKEVDLVQNIAENLPTVWADPTRVRQVILNLVSNACKFTDSGSITLSASAGDEHILIAVADTGIGIADDQVDSVFEEFTQVDASTTRKVGGTGLGLPISRHFVEMHHGKIWVESTPGRGSTFYVKLPLQPVEEEEHETETETPEEEEAESNDKVVLAIDDDPGVITLYERFLEKQDYKIIGVHNSRNVVEQAKEYQPMAILLDVLIPDKDGWGVIRELKADSFTRDIPVIICSIVSDKNKGFSLGAADYLIKPIMEEELVKALRNLENTEKNEVKVLVVDDQADDILLIRRILEAQSNYNIIEAKDGNEGLALVKSLEPDLIILDLTMPEMDGFSVVEALKEDEKARTIPIVIVSARELKPAEQEFLNGQVEALLRKGLFTENELLEDVSRALQRIKDKEFETA